MSGIAHVYLLEHYAVFIDAESDLLPATIHVQVMNFFVAEYFLSDHLANIFVSLLVSQYFVKASTQRHQLVELLQSLENIGGLRHLLTSHPVTLLLQPAPYLSQEGLCCLLYILTPFSRLILFDAILNGGQCVEKGFHTTFIYVFEQLHEHTFLHYFRTFYAIL